ncbi:AAA family ATPase [Streptomyces sp. NPDC059224]|uniref:AAA family ATPase n=1 Tax=Streptomyces sp. NPDC059224 TaxID=3346775 RepID=UPI0036B4EDC4
MTAPAGFLVVPALDLAPGTLLVAVGPGASGKSTYAATAAVDVVICLDSLRREIGGAEGDQSVIPAAVERQNALLEQHLSAGATVFLDATSLMRECVQAAGHAGSSKTAGSVPLTIGSLGSVSPKNSSTTPSAAR